MQPFGVTVQFGVAWKPDAPGQSGFIAEMRPENRLLAVTVDFRPGLIEAFFESVLGIRLKS